MNKNVEKKLYSLNTNYSLEEVFCKILFVVVYTDITTNAHGSVVAPGCNQLLTNLNTFEYTYNVNVNGQQFTRQSTTFLEIDGNYIAISKSKVRLISHNGCEQKYESMWKIVFPISAN